MFDGAALLGICDKIVPGLLIGALRFGHLPVMLVPGGPMPSGLASRCRPRDRWTAFPTASVRGETVAVLRATVDRAVQADLAAIRTARDRAMGRAGGLAVQAADRRVRASHRKESRGLVDLGRRIR